MHVHKNDAKRKIILKHCFFVSRERNKLKATVDSLKDSVQKGSRFNVRPESIADFENREFYVKLLELEILIEKRISEGELFSKTRKRRQCTFVIYKRKFTKEILIEISFIRLYNNEKIKNFFLMTQGLPTHSTKRIATFSMTFPDLSNFSKVDEGSFKWYDIYFDEHRVHLYGNTHFIRLQLNAQKKVDDHVWVSQIS